MEVFKIKIAVAKNGSNVSAHFGHCDGYSVFEIEKGEVVSKDFLAYPGHKPGFLPGFLSENGVNVIIAGGMGASAQELFKQNNICVIVGASGSIEEVIERYAKGLLESDESVCNHEH